MTGKHRIRPGTNVSLQFQLKLADGTVIEETRPGEMFEFAVGDGALVEGLEQRLLDLCAGDQVTFNVPAEEGVFGYPEPDKVHSMRRDEFSGSMEIAPGSVVEFELPNGEEVLGVITKLNDDEVTVDFNHPLIGRDFIFEVTIAAVVDHDEGEDRSANGPAKDD